MNQIVFDGHYLRNLSDTLSRNATTTQPWNIAVGMKLEQDGIIQSSSTTFWKTNNNPINDIQSYVTELQSELRKQFADKFISMKCTKKKELDFSINKPGTKQPFYKVELSNFSFTLSFVFRMSRGGDFIFYPCIWCYRYTETEQLYISKPIDGLVSWLKVENEEMPAFRTEWDKLCKSLRKQAKCNNLNEAVISAMLDEALSDTKIEHSVTSGTNDFGQYIDIVCPPMDLSFHIPSGYENWKSIVDIFVDIIKKHEE